MSVSAMQCNVLAGAPNLFPHPRVHKLSEEFVQLAAATALTSDCKAFTTKEIFAPRWPHPHPATEPGFMKTIEDLFNETGENRRFYVISIQRTK